MIAPASRIRQRLRQLKKFYVSAAILLLNTIVVYVILNVAFGALFLVRDTFRQKSNPVSLTYGSRLDAVYPDFPEPERTQMLSEAWNRPYQYADFIHFQERPCVGKYVNVDEAGFRHSIDQGPWPPRSEHLNVFCFGGSTTFGYGVTDEQTVGSHLQQALTLTTKQHVCVYNFGVGWHFSTQERIRFEQLLAADIVPDIALFLDGINDSTQACLNRPAFSPQLAAAFEQVQGFGAQRPASGTTRAGSLSESLFYQWPVGRLARSLAARKPVTTPETFILDAKSAARSCAVYRWNRTLITAAAKARGVIPIFVLQPAPGYHLDESKHLFANADLCRNEALFYETMQQDLKTHLPGDNFLWCADLADTTAGPLYVDTCHYTDKFSQVIANDIVQKCNEKGLVESNKK
jgi:lysophospholipase L1-like esterase